MKCKYSKCNKMSSHNVAIIFESKQMDYDLCGEHALELGRFIPKGLERHQENCFVRECGFPRKGGCLCASHEKMAAKWPNMRPWLNECVTVRNVVRHGPAIIQDVVPILPKELTVKPRRASEVFIDEEDIMRRATGLFELEKIKRHIESKPESYTIDIDGVEIVFKPEEIEPVLRGKLFHLTQKLCTIQVPEVM